MDLTDAGLQKRADRFWAWWDTWILLPRLTIEQEEMLACTLWERDVALRDATRAEQREMDARIAEEQPIDVEDTTQSIGMCHRIAAAIRAQKRE